jgi:hypothetical protein
MPDTPTATEGATGGDSPASYGNEFSHPVGKEDGAIWEKHFGKDAKWTKESEDRGRGKTDREKKPEPKESRSSKDSASTSSKDKGSKSDAGGAKDTPAAKPKDSSKSTTDESSKSSKERPASDKEASTPKESKSPKKDDASEKSDSTGRKTAEEKDDAEPSRKARETFEKAKAEQDIPTKRKLFRQAMTEAFGEVPDEFNDAKLASIRKRHADTERALSQQKQQNEQRIQDAVKQLQPAIAIMRKVKDAGLGDYTMAQLDHAVEVMAELRRLEQGDYTGLAQLVSKAAKVDPEEAMKRFVRGVKVSPEGQAVRAAAKAAEDRAARAEQQVQELARRLQEREQQQTKAQQEQERRAKVEARRAEYTSEVESELEGHPVLKLDRGLQRVVAQLIKTADPKTRTARYSPTRVADAIVDAEKKRAARVAALESGDEDPPARSGARTPSVTRRDSAENGVPNPDPMARFEEIWEKHTPQRRAAGGRR